MATGLPASVLSNLIAGSQQGFVGAASDRLLRGGTRLARPARLLGGWLVVVLALLGLSLVTNLYNLFGGGARGALRSVLGLLGTAVIGALVWNGRAFALSLALLLDVRAARQVAAEASPVPQPVPERPVPDTGRPLGRG